MHLIALVGNVCSRKLDLAFHLYPSGLCAAMGYNPFSISAITQFLVAVESPIFCSHAPAYYRKIEKRSS